jgi:hypothetical protein
MNIQHEVVECKVCRNSRQFLEYEKINLVIHKEDDPIGNCPKVPAVNLHFYCNTCKTNTSEPYPYENEKIIPMFIKDVQKHSTHFDNITYREVEI